MNSLTPRYPHLLHGGDYNPDQWLDYPEVLQRDIELMKEANINCVSVAIFAWAKLEPQEGVYDFDWLEKIINNLYDNGIYTVLATPSGGKPVWMSEKYPEIRRVQNDLVRDETGDRENHCYTSPIYREKVKAINTKLAERFASHPGVILWHLSNEYCGECYCPLCRAEFREWLKKKYGTLEKLNSQWWTAFWSHTYTDWEQINPPLKNGEHATHALVLDWKRFCTDRVIDFMKWERDAVRAVNPDIPVTTNFMYYFDNYNYFKFKDELDVVSWDSYPQWHGGNNADLAADVALWHDVMRSIKDKPFLLMECTPSMTNWTPVSRLKRPGVHMAQCMQAVAHGSNSIQYFQIRKSRGSQEKLHGAVIDHSGRNDTMEFKDVKAVGDRLAAIDEICGSTVNAEVALIYDTENRWAIDNAAGPRNCGTHYVENVQKHYRALWQLGVPVDVIDEECDISKYKVVVAPMLYILRGGFEKKLEEFVKNGGTLISSFMTGYANENDLCYLGGWPGGGLMDVFGLWNETTDSLYDGEVNHIVTNDGKSYEVKELCAIIHTQGAETLGVYGDDFYKGEPAFTVNSYGKGKAYYMGASAEAAMYSDFYTELVKTANIKTALPGVTLPVGVEAAVRENGDTAYVFVQNFSGEEKTLVLPDEYTLFPEGEAVKEINLPAYGSIILRGNTK